MLTCYDIRLLLPHGTQIRIAHLLKLVNATYEAENANCAKSVDLEFGVDIIKISYDKNRKEPLDED